MKLIKESIAITTDASGDATVYSGAKVTGKLVQYVYRPAAVNPLDTGADFTITAEDSAMDLGVLTNIGTAVVARAVRQPIHDLAGAQALYAAGGQAVRDYIWIVNERIKLVVAQGGNAKNGTLDVYYEAAK